VNNLSYNSTQRFFHWLTFLLVGFQFAVAWTMSEPPKGQPPVGLMNLHLSVGLTVLILMSMRLAWRATHAVPPPAIGTPKWQVIASRAVHSGFYLVLIVLPFAGWTWSSAKGWPVTFFGIVALPPLVATGSANGRLAADIHETLSIVLLVLGAIHVLAALHHHYVLKDGTLRRMLPAAAKGRSL